MDITAPSRSSSAASWLCGGIGVLGAVVGIWAWATSGQFSHLLTGAAFGVMAPVWYVRPLSFTAPLHQELTRRREPLPKWALACLVVGLTMLFSGVLLRWAM